ncbi:chemotaxis regulator CheZ [Rhodobiaceae bacterium]|nr:chemotaxis regulator CheZ [Rhodobiaceae bacterium]
MGNPRRRFRIETVNIHTRDRVESGEPVALATEMHVPDSVASERHQEIMDAIGKLGHSVDTSAVADLALPDAAPDALLDKYKEEIKEAAKLKSELDLMQAAIQRTKSEIVALRYDGASSERIRSVTDELDEVVAGTEAATEGILGAVELIDSNASALGTTLTGVEASQALEIQEQVVAIFEACNFQDITGQRITKVVNALRYIEERIESMQVIWGESGFDGVEAADDGAAGADVPEGRALASGPSMPEADDRASQADIDALFD